MPRGVEQLTWLYRRISGTEVQFIATNYTMEPTRQLRGKTLWAALAVLIDGEGCVRIARSHRASGIHAYQAEIRVANTNIQWLEYWRNMTGIGRISKPIRVLPQEKERAYWIICKKDNVAHVLNNILPYLFCKQRQAAICLDFLKNKTCVPWGQRAWTRPSEQELAWREDMYIKIRLLNKKGSESVETTRQASPVDDDIVRSAEPSAEWPGNEAILALASVTATNQPELAP